MMIITVRIDKSIIPKNWYANMIGQEIEVTEKPIKRDGRNSYLRADVSTIKWVIEEDCTIVSEQAHFRSF